MLLHQNDVVVDRVLEKVIITIDISTETDFRDYESGYENSSGETTEPSVKQRRVYSLYERCNLAEITLFLMKFDLIL